MRSEGVERGLVTPFLLPARIFSRIFCNRHVSRSLDESLARSCFEATRATSSPSGFQLGKLGLRRSQSAMQPGTQTRHRWIPRRHIVATNLADFLEMLVQETFPLVGRDTTCAMMAPAAGHDSAVTAFQRQRHVVPAQRRHGS